MKISAVKAVVVDVSTEAQAAEAAEMLRGCPVLSVDTETTGLEDQFTERVVWCGFHDGRHAVAVPIEFLHHFQDILEKQGPDGPRTLIFHNAKYDGHMLANHGINIFDENIVHDTMVLSWLWDNSERHGLKYLAREYCGMKLQDFKTVIKRRRGDKTPPILLASRPLVVRYLGLDVVATWRLWHVFKEKLEHILHNEQSAWEYFCEVEAPFTKVLFWMERHGVAINGGMVKEKLDRVEERLDELMSQMVPLAGRADFNPKSPKHLQELFINNLGLRVAKKTAKGNISMDESVLSAWAEQGIDAAGWVLEYRRLNNKVRSTYLLPLQRAAETRGRTHCDWVQTGTETGRISSRRMGDKATAKSTNLMNIPVRVDPFRIREVFVPAEGYKLLVLDYSQLEVIVSAALSRDKAMCDAILGGKDLHAVIASRIFNLDYDEIAEAKRVDDSPGEELSRRQKDLLRKRGQAKTVLFCTLYGGGAPRVAAQTGLGVEEAESLIDGFFAASPGLKQAEAVAHTMARRFGYTTTIIGRRRKLPDVWSDNSEAQGHALRAAWNHQIQGSASDIIKRSMIQCHDDPELGEMGVRLLMQVHDELHFEVPEEADEAMVITRVKHHMVNPWGIELGLPLSVSGGYGYNWLEAK